MARNEEKQQGRLNRLWLQKEREEGRLKDAHERRPKLSTLNSASSVKKWIPSIKNEIEYYLQQSQLSHYPERKISEFQLRIDALEKEYRHFIAKLRVLDPSCKHKPWSPRAYCKRRADTQDSPSIAKNPRPCKSHVVASQSCRWTGCIQTSERQEPLCHSETMFQDPIPTNLNSKTPEAICGDQDQPLSFNHTRLSVATAAFRGTSVQQGSSQAQNLARVLQSSLPNLINSSLRQTFSTQNRDKDDRTVTGFVIGQKSDVRDSKSECDTVQRMPGKSSSTGTTEEITGNVLGLECYSSSDEGSYT